MAKAATPKAAKPAAKPAVKRTSQKLTMSQTKIVEAQFEVRLKNLTQLDVNLAEIEKKFDNTDHFVPLQIAGARLKVGEALVALGEAKAEFELIGEKYRSFFG